MASWWRSWHGAPNDPKWRVIARIAQVDLRDVIATAWALLDYASQHPTRGSVEGADPDVIGESVGVDGERVEQILLAMHTKNILRDSTFAAWHERQPKREDDSSARVTQHRERKSNEAKRSETACNAPVTQPLAHVRGRGRASESVSVSPLSVSLTLGEEVREEEKKSLEVPISRARPRFGEWPSEKDAREAFAKWWPMYFKRGGRTEAFEVFVRFVSPAEMDELMQATAAHAAFRAKDVKPADPDGKKFTQGAKTWLLNRRWRDWLKTDEVEAQMAATAPVLTPAQKAGAEARRKGDLLRAELERRAAEKRAEMQGRLLP